MSIEQGKISKRQAIFLLANSILASMVLIAPALMAKQAGQDAWIAVLIAGVFGLLFGMLVVSVGLRHPGKNMVEYGIDLLGPWLGRAVAIIFALFFLHTNAYLVRSFGSLLVTETMPETPLVVFNILIVLIAAYAAYLGLEVFTRVNDIVFPLSMLVAVAIVAMGLPEVNFENLKPIFTHPIPNILQASFILFAFFAEGTILLMLIPSLRQPNEARQLVVPVSLIISLAMLVDVGILIGLFGHEETSRMVFPTYEFAKTVGIWGFLERIESLVVGVWVATVGLKVATFYYVSVLTFTQTFNLKDYRSLVLPYAIILVVLSMVGWMGTNEVTLYMSRYFPLFAIIVVGGTTLLLYLANMARRQGSSGGGKKNEDKVNQN
jgi:spore germination protein KB